MKQPLLYIIVFISGAAVLAVEILGTRMLGPFYGVSLFLWSALITITLAALSIGYAVGGRWADRRPSYARLAAILAGAAAWLFVTPWLRQPLLLALEPLGLRAAVLAAALLLFFVPLGLLGMVGPFAIRLRATDLASVGKTAGDIYAVSTVASVIAALLTGFVLIPQVGVSRLILWIAVLLLGAAGLSLTAGRRAGRALPVHLLLFAAAAAGAGMIPVERADPEAGILEMRHSPYSEIRVLEWEGVRMLILDGGLHTATEPGAWRPQLQYAVVLDAVKYLFAEPGDLCLVGLGGGSVMKSFDRSGWQVDAVEIDPDIVSVARRHFGLAEEEGRVVVMDGRRYFRSTDRDYDLVVLDAFGSSAIPFHLVTRESFATIKNRLRPGGVLALNIECQGWYDILVRALAATLATNFAHVIAMPIAEPQTMFGNLILLASDRPLEMNEALLGNPFDYLDDEYWHWTVVERNHAWRNRFTPDTKGVPVLTDDLNPVDLWSEALNYTARKDLHTTPAWRRLAY